MSYADQSVSNRRLVSIAIVVVIHLLLGYALITGLGTNFIKKMATDLKTFDVEDEPPPPPDKPPPPPPEQKVEPPPMVAPPPIVSPPQISAPVAIQVVPRAPVIITPQAPPAPPPPRVSQAASARGDPAQWITNDDYPPSAQRDGREGVSVIAWEVNTAGKVENCHVTQSSGSSDLDETACRVLTRRGKYTPAKDQDGNPIRQNQSRRVRWVLPRD